MGRRVDLHQVFETILGSKNVYFQPPESVKLKYPCIIYDLSKLPVQHADDKPYLMGRGYDGILIDANPDTPLLDKLRKLPFLRVSEAISGRQSQPLPIYHLLLIRRGLHILYGYFYVLCKEETL
ncbi:MAG: hypothetical protein ACLR4A_02880 [Christensenellales bacterium]